VSGPEPEFVRVADWAVLATPILVLLNVSVVGAATAVGTATPVPVNEANCVEPEILLALSVKVTYALRVPDAVGVKLTVTTQLAAGASVRVHVLVVCAKSPAFTPVSVMPLISSVSVPGFFNVIVCVALVTPMLVLLNVNDAGVSVVDGMPYPVPVRARVCGEPVALSVT
jgi:hypothetical protein